HRVHSVFLESEPGANRNFGTPSLCLESLEWLGALVGWGHSRFLGDHSTALRGAPYSCSGWYFLVGRSLEILASKTERTYQGAGAHDPDRANASGTRERSAYSL